MAKASYNALGWSDYDMPPGFILIEVYVENNAEARLFFRWHRLRRDPIETCHHFPNSPALVGHSLGGTAAVYFAHKHSDKNWTVLTFGAPKTTQGEDCSVVCTRVHADDDLVYSGADGVDFMLGNVRYYNHNPLGCPCFGVERGLHFVLLLLCCPGGERRLRPSM